MVNNQQEVKRRYRGSLLAQSILQEEQEKTTRKEEMLSATNFHYRRLEYLQALVLLWGGLSLCCLLGLVIVTVARVLLLKLELYDFFSGNYIPLNKPIKHFLLDKWQFNVAAGVIGVCCIHLDRIITAKKEQIKKETDDNQLAKDYLAWKSSGKKSIES